MSGFKILLIVCVAISLSGTHAAMITPTNQRDPSLRENILSTDYHIAKGALDENSKKKDTRLVCLSLKNQSLLIRKEAAEALKQIGAKPAVACLIEALEDNQVVYTGGTETRVLQQQLNDALVAALEQLTGLTLQTKSPPLSDTAIRRIIQRTKRWWSENRRR